MPADFDLVVRADYPNRTAELRLLDAHGAQLAYRHTEFKTIPVGLQRGLFDLRNFLRHYVEPGQESAKIAEVGVCIAERVLGEEIFLKLWKPTAARTLRIELPAASEDENLLAAALARVPWEIARPSAGEPSLAERNLLVTVVHEMTAEPSPKLTLQPDESLRVLFVFAEAPGSRPLAARREMRELKALFEKEIYPQRRVVAHTLSHGVTRQRLAAQIEENGGYHIVHWSGHGGLNALELAKPGGGRDLISGQELLGVFEKAGGFYPRLFFLSACHSGDIKRIEDWQDFLQVAQNEEIGGKEAPPAETKDLQISREPGYTGMAHALLAGGVHSVVAMRYAVGDDYARDLALEFYRALLAHPQPKNAAAALTSARRALLDPTMHEGVRYGACDHATPLLYGDADPGLALPKGRSPALDTSDPRRHRIVQLTLAAHPHFVGRTWDLAGFGAEFIGASLGTEVRPVALVVGLGGMGKTALAAEALDLWQRRFEHVLLYQAKPNALVFEATLSDIHLKLMGELGRYHAHVQARPADAVFRAGDAGFTGPARFERLIRNLIRAMRDEPILLVLDNFETNLRPGPEASAVGAEPVWACQDPAWDACLAQLADELVGTPSRVLVTCRRPLAALADKPQHLVRLGPLSPGDARLFLREHAALSRMIFGADDRERALAMRLLDASRFHPLLMDRLAKLAAGGPALRQELLQTLDTLEKKGGLAELPSLFAVDATDAKELAYLEDALVTSNDQLIADVGPEARRLLWMIALANEPITLDLLRGAWGGEGLQRGQLEQFADWIGRLGKMPPDPATLASRLLAVGLATAERDGPEDANPDLTCHEVVRGRIRAWMVGHPQDQAGLTEAGVRVAYAERLEAVFTALLHKNQATALEAGGRAIVYFVEAQAYDRLAGIASAVVTSSADPQFLSRLLPHLAAAAQSAPEGRARWSCLHVLADGLRQAGRPDASLPFYEQATALARAAVEAGGPEGAAQAWADLAVTTGNWAFALRGIGDLPAAGQQMLSSAEAYRHAGVPAVNVLASELGALRIDVMQGRGSQARPEIYERLAQIRGWWQQHRSGAPAPEAPDLEFLARALVGALDIARQADYVAEDWESALAHIDESIEVRLALDRLPNDVARDRMNRANVLVRLKRFAEAGIELEHCLSVFRDDPAEKARTLSSLASLFDAQGDFDQAILQERRALAIRNTLPDPGDRAISHDNLADYMERSGDARLGPESARHRLVGAVYRIVSGLGQHLQISVRTYAASFRRAGAAGTEPVVPRLAELGADPAFHPFAEWLRRRNADPAEVQAAVDHYLDVARKIARGEQPGAAS
jgi:tetratricopeptide (TPR) repeat protein